MIILLYAVMIVISGILAVLAAEYQECYIKEQELSFKHIKLNFFSRPLQFIVFLILYLLFTGLAIFFYQKKNLNPVQLPQYVIFWECLLAGAWIDFKVKKIPNVVFLLLLGVRTIGIMIEIAYYPEALFQILLDAFSGLLTGGLITMVCRLISRGGLGAGDVKLFALTGYYFGIIPTMNILFYTTFLSAVFAGFLLISKKAKMKSTLALGPFVFIGLNIYYILLS
ncbi:MAG: A24 family peptidase [Oscillospiraceae bacterium]|nr:A24 family peptidase [Oscillospiraceae bacterium]